MKLLGLIGGMSWESTAIYYRGLNELVRSRFGGWRSADLLIRSFDFEPIAVHQAKGNWGQLEAMMVDTARLLEQARAEGLIICSNTMHKFHDAVQAAVSIPVLHIADPTAEALRARGCSRPLLLATRFTMEQNFYRERLAAGFGIDALIPDEAGRTAIHDIIYNELCQGIIKADSKSVYLAEIQKARKGGADSVIFGCTEVCMLISQSDLDLPAFDTTALHIEAAMTLATS